MRRINKHVSALMLIAFLLHAVFGSLEFVGAWSKTIQTLTMVFAFVFLGLFLAHTFIGVALASKSAGNMRQSKTIYFRENAAFWVRFISGLALTAFALAHAIIFLGIMWQWFPMGSVMTPMLVIDIFLGISLLAHLLFSMRALLIDWGIKTNKIAVVAIAILIVALCAYLIASFVVFYVGALG